MFRSEMSAEKVLENPAGFPEHVVQKIKAAGRRRDAAYMTVPVPLREMNTAENMKVTGHDPDMIPLPVNHPAAEAYVLNGVFRADFCPDS